MSMSSRAQTDDDLPSSDLLSRCSSALDDSVSSVLGRWGTIVALNPWKVFAGSLLLALLLGGGLSMAEQETQDLWTPYGAQVLEDRDIFDKFFGSGFRTQTIYMKAQEEDGNVISKDVLGAAVELDKVIRQNEFQVTVGDIAYGFQELCDRARETDPCGERVTFVSYYNEPSGTLAAMPAEAKRTFAGVVNGADGAIIEASTVKLTYILSRVNDTNEAESGSGANPALVWENELVDYLETYDAINDKVRVYVQVENSISSVLGSIIGGDIIGLNIGFMCIILYAILVLGKFHPVHSRSAVAFGGVVCVGLAILGTYGLAGYVGVPITPVTSLLPFILVGIGVDDMFVLVGSLDRAPKNLDITSRITLMMREAGSSITMTSLTDMLAFALGCTTSFPALRYFCVYAAIGIMLDFLFQCTIFVCLLVWDEQRRVARAADCFCCIACCAKEGEKFDCCYVKESDMEKACCNDKCCIKDGGHLRGFIRDNYAPILKNQGVKLVVIILMLSLLAIGIVGMTQLREDFSLRFFVPSDDPLQDVFDITDKEFQSGETVIDIILDHRDDVVMHAATTHAEVERVTSAVEGFRYYEQNTLSSPLDSFADWLETQNPPISDLPADAKTFYDHLHRFLSTEGARMAGMVSLYDWYVGFNTFLLDAFEGKSAREEVDIGGTRYTRAAFDPVTMRPLSPEHMCSILTAYLAGPGSNFQTDVDVSSGAQCYAVNGDVQVHRVSAAMKCRLDPGECPPSNATAAIEIMDGMRDAMADLNSPLKPIAFSFSFLDSEQFAVVRQEAVTNIALAIVAVAVVTLFMLGHVFAGVIVVANVAMVLVDIVGLMWLWDITINSVSIINLVLAIGLAVDYSAHIAHAFMHATGTRDERVVNALSEMGADVAHGAVSTFVAVLVTSGSRSYIFQVFFRQFFGICFFGIIHGLVVLPVILSLIGPATQHRPSTLSSGSDIEMQDDVKSPVQTVSGEQALAFSGSRATNAMDMQGLRTTAPNMDVGTAKS